MAMTAYTEYISLPIETGISSGTSSLVLAGDQSDVAWLEAGSIVTFIEGTKFEEMEVDSVTYDGIEDETTVVFTENFTESYTTAGTFNKLQGQIKVRSGSLEGNNVDTSFSAASLPTEVRIYSSTTPHGSLLAYDSTPGWTYNAGLAQVELSFTPDVGETVVSFGDGNWLFGSDFLCDDVQEEIVSDVYVYLSSEYDCVYAGFNEIESTDVDASWFEIGKEVSEGTWEYHSYQTFCEIDVGDVVHMKVRVTLLDDTVDIKNYYNTTLYLGHLTIPTD